MLDAELVRGPQAGEWTFIPKDVYKLEKESRADAGVSARQSRHLAINYEF